MTYRWITTCVAAAAFVIAGCVFLSGRAANEEGFRRPEVVYQPVPVYPETARIMSVEGDVVLDLHVTSAGAVDSLAVVSGSEVFHAAAADAVWDMRFTPALQGGRPADIWARQTVRFRLTDLLKNIPLVPYDEADVKPSVIQEAVPEYPVEALRQRREGDVYFSLTVNVHGQAEDLRILSGQPVFYHEAFTAMALMRFSPGMENNRPVRVSTTHRVVFNLADAEEEPMPLDSVEVPPRLIRGALTDTATSNIAQVDVELVVGRNGCVIRSRVVSGPEEHYAEALRRARDLYYMPARKGQRPVRVRIVERLEFTSAN